MKQINVKLLVILVVGAVVTLGGIKWLHDFQEVRGADTLLVRAEAAAENGDYQQQVKLLRGYLNRRPDDDEQFSTLALALKKFLEESREPGRRIDPKLVVETYGVIEHALRLRPDNPELRTAAIDFTMMFGRWGDAIDHIGYLAKSEGDELDKETQIKLAQCQYRSGQENKAMNTLSSMIGFDPVKREFTGEGTAPDEAMAYTILASIYQMNKSRPEVAQLILDRMIEMNPESADAYTQRARFLRSGDDEQKQIAVEDAAKALELTPDEPETLLLAAQVAMDAKDYSRAKELYDHVIELEPENVDALKGLSLWAVATQDVDGALGYLQRAAEIDPDNPLIILQQANMELEAGNYKFVADAIERMRDLNVAPHFRDFLQGRVHLAKKEWLRAAEKLESSRPQLEQSRREWITAIDASLALCYENLSQHDLRKEAFQRILTREPGNLMARWGKIEALRSLNQTDAALEEYSLLERQFSVHEKTSGRLLIPHLSLELLQQRNRDEDQRNWSEAEQLVRRILKETRVSKSAKASVLAQYYTEIGEKEKAQAILEKARGKDPDNLVLKLSKVGNLASTDLEAAHAQLDEIQAQHGDMAAIRLLRAQLILAGGGEDRIEKVRALAENTSTFPANERMRLYARMGQLLIVARDFGGARQLWQKVADAQPDNVQIRIGIFELALQDGDLTKRAAALEQLKDVVGDDGAEMKWARAMQILWDVKRNTLPESELAQARALAEDAISMREGWEPLYRLSGELSLRLKEPQKALTAFTRAAELGAMNPEVFRNLAVLNFDSQNFDECRKYLDKLPKNMWSPREKMINLDLLARAGELPEDIEFDEKSDNAMDHLRVGGILAAAGRLNDADKAFRRAIKLAPQSPEAWGSLFSLYATNGQMEAAQTVMRDAEAQLSEINAAMFAGSALHMLKDYEASEKYYQSAMEMEPKNLVIMRSTVEMYLASNQVAKAKSLLETMSEVAKKNSEDDSAHAQWARRRLASIIVQDRTYASYARAVDLLRQNIGDSGVMKREDLLTYAPLAAARPDSASRQAAIELLESTRQKRLFSDRERLALASLYEREGRWTECKSEMEGLLVDAKNVEVLLDSWLSWLVRHKELDKAATWVRKAKPNSISAIRTRAHIDLARGRSQQAVERLKQIVPKEDTPQAAAQVRVVAAMAEELAYQDKRIHKMAESLWARYAKSGPQGMLDFAAYLARRDDRPVQALAALNKVRKTGLTGPVLQQSIGVIRKHKDELEPKHIQVVQGWFDEALAEAPSNATLYVFRSELEDVLGDPAAAEEFLRKYLASESANPRERGVVANNLAFKLALRGDGDEAAQLVDEAVRMLGPQLALKDTMAMVYVAQQEYDKAIAELQPVLASNPSPEKYFHLALAQWRSGDRASGAESMQKALDLGVAETVAETAEEQLFLDFRQELMDAGILRREPDSSDLDEPSTASAADAAELD